MEKIHQKKRPKTGGRKPSTDVPSFLLAAFVRSPKSAAEWILNAHLCECAAKDTPSYTDVAIARAAGLSPTMIKYYRRFFKWSVWAQKKVSDSRDQIKMSWLSELSRQKPGPHIDGAIEMMLDGAFPRRRPRAKAVEFYYGLSGRERTRALDYRKERDELKEELRKARALGELGNFKGMSERLREAEAETARLKALPARTGERRADKDLRAPLSSVDQGAREDELRGALSARVKILDFGRGLLHIKAGNTEVLEGLIEKITLSHGAVHRDISLRGEDSVRGLEDWLSKLLSARAKISGKPLSEMTIDCGSGESLDRFIDQILRESWRKSAYKEFSVEI